MYRRTGDLKDLRGRTKAMNKSSSKLNTALLYENITECQRYNMQPTIHTAIKLLEMRFSVLHLNSLHDICVRPDISATFSHTFAIIEIFNIPQV